MKAYLSIIILIFNLQSWTKADDIRDLQIEGMSMGESLLDYFSKSEIENSNMNYYKKKKFITIGFNNSSFLKIEYINFLLDNDLKEKYYIIDNLKFDKNIMNEYFYYYIYGKYYNKLDLESLSSFYFCQFYKTINSKNKADFFCKKYDIKDIPTLDKSYALFK